jgi:uncharacterized membrane protein YcaP (DUF421 family)
MASVESLWSAGEHVLGLEVKPEALSALQMCARSVVVFIWGIAIVRFGDRRLLGRNAGFDMLLLVVLGSVLSRGVNGQSAFFPTLAASGFLVVLHHLLSIATCRFHGLSILVKGTSRTLISGGRLDAAEARRSRISLDDLKENLRLNGNVGEIAEVKDARLERNGAISVVPKQR